MDVYSFGLIMWELYHSVIPFDGDISNCISCVVQEDLRPEIRQQRDSNVESDDESRIHDSYIAECSRPISDLIRRCWVSDPNLRPDFNTILSLLWKETTYYYKKETVVGTELSDSFEVLIK